MLKSIFVPILTYGHESWAMTERVRSQMQASKTRFLQNIKGVTMFDKHRNTAIHESLDIESLYLRIKRFQLRWLGYVSRMAQERFLKPTLYAKMSGKKPVGRPRTRWFDYVEDLEIRIYLAILAKLLKL